MTYLVLARKWRPRTFETLVGQDHVVRALSHALTTQRLHHAWLFTGTRGVGKTTLSRILAKALNCETGITATPCGICQACTSIDEGRFVDYLELDAASNRGVEEMTQLLEQAVYSPSVGRFKVYMIDEVHMLTGHAFNAMLKTLEEPPPHVKFILATTDPQKIPVTVLSRCLQFNLKQMPGDSIVGHLEHVLADEQIAFEVPALRLLGQAASGSMRDALSLTDQAIAYSAGNLTEESVRGMLGTIDQRHLIRLLDALHLGYAPAVLEIADELSTRGLSYRAALGDLAVLLSRIAIIQRVPQAADLADPLVQDVVRLATTLHPDAVQLFYTVAVHSRSELAIAPDEYAGFVMACLRMLSLLAGTGAQSPLQGKPPSVPATPVAPLSPSPSSRTSAPAPVPVPVPVPARTSSPEPEPTATATATPPAAAPASVRPVSQASDAASVPFESAVSLPATPAAVTVATTSAALAVAAPAPVSVVATPTQTAAQALGQPELARGATTRVIPPWESEQDEAVESLESLELDEDFMDNPAEYVATHSHGQAASVLSAISRSLPPHPEPDLAAPAGFSEIAPVQSGVLTLPEPWESFSAKLPLSGLASQLARQSECTSISGQGLTLRVPTKALTEGPHADRLRTVLTEYFGFPVQLQFEIGAVQGQSAHTMDLAAQIARQEQAELSMQNDPFVQALVRDFGAQVVPGSVRPAEAQ